MSFDRIRSDLRGMDQKLSEGGQITAAELFNMIRDLCEDVRTETGQPVEKNPTGDTAQLLRQLPWMGRLISRQFRSIEDQVLDRGRQDELEEKMRELDALAERLELQAGQTTVLEDKRKALRSRYAMLEAGEEKKLALQRECEKLETLIHTASEVTVPQLEERLDQMKQRQNELDARVARLRQEQSETDSHCCQTEAECVAISQTMEQLTVRREELTRTRDRKAGELEQLRQVMSELDSECARLQQRLDQLSHDLADKDREQAKRRLNESIRQREQLLEEYEQLQGQLAQLQEQKWKAEQANQQAQERMSQLQKQIGEARGRQEALAAEEKTLTEQIRQSEQWLQSLELQQYIQRLEQLRQRNALLTDAKTALQADLRHIRAVKGIAPEEPEPAVLQASFDDTEKWITHHQKLFSDTISLLSEMD